MKDLYKKEKGFSLVEVVITLFFVSAIITSAVTLIHKAKDFTQEQERVMMAYIIAENTIEEVKEKYDKGETIELDTNIPLDNGFEKHITRKFYEHNNNTYYVLHYTVTITDTLLNKDAVLSCLIDW